MKCHWGTPCYCETLATRDEYPDPANGQRAEETEAVITIIERTNLVVRRETSPSEYPQQTNHGPKNSSILRQIQQFTHPMLRKRHSALKR